MLDFPAQRPPAGAIAMLTRLQRDYGWPHKWGYVAGAFLLLIVAGATATSAWLLKPVLNGMAGAERFADMRPLAFAVLGLFVLRGLATYGALVILSRAGNRIVATAQRRVFDHLLRQNMLFFQDRHSSEFVARLALAANGVRDALQFVIQGVARDALMVASLVAVMALRDPLLTVLALCVLPVAILLLRRVIRRVRSFARRSFDGSTSIMQTMSETVLGMRIIKAFNLEETMRRRMSGAIKEVERSANRISAGGALAVLMADSLAGLAIGFAIYYGSWRISVHHGDVGSFVSFLAALLMAYEPIRRFGRLHADVQK